MRIHPKNIDKDSMRRDLFVMAGIAVNVVLAFIANRVGLPLYLDTVGTVAVAAVAGTFPGIMAAVTTNILCSFFNEGALYFSFVSALIAIFTARFAHRYPAAKAGQLLRFILLIGLISGLIMALIQWGLVGGAQSSAVEDTVTLLQEATDLPVLSVFLGSAVLMNLIDKAIAVVAAYLIIRFMPQRLVQSIRDSSWKQKPLTEEELKSINKWNWSFRRSIRARIFLMLMGVSLALVLIMGWSGISLYYENVKTDRTENAESAVRFAASIVDPDRIDTYLAEGREAPGYDETEELLYRIRDNSKGVKYLYLVKFKQDGCHFIFDLDTEDTPANPPGTRIDFEEAFLPYVPALLNGEEIQPIESDDASGWVLTVYYPVKDEQGNCVCYAGADVSLEYMADYTRTFLLRVLTILAGFFILVIAYGLWTTGVFMVYPINSIMERLNAFIRTGGSQEELDERVRQIRALDIHTGDETQALYLAICDVTLNMAEQVREVRHFSEATEKMQSGLIITMADMVENRDSDTGAHIQKTAAYVKIILDGLQRKGYYPEKLTPKYISDVVRSAPLHDVGKINISDTVLNKPGKLTDEEFAIMKTHTTAGKKIMESAISTVQGESYLKEARNMAAYHHERWDGRGYPEGLHGEVIPLSARVMAVADVFDALTSPRVYKPAFPLEKALEILQEGAGSQFDPKCVEVFMDALPEVKAVLKKYQGMQGVK